MIFFRVYSYIPYLYFGGYERINNIQWEEGDIVKNVYATPHIGCVANMLAWHNDKVWEVEGGHSSESFVVVIESNNYYRPPRNENYNKDTDKDEVIIREGVVLKKYNPKEFVNNYKIPVMGIYSFLNIYPNK